MRILKNIDGIAHIELDEEDVVRHKLVKAIIKAYEKERSEKSWKSITSIPNEEINKQHTTRVAYRLPFCFYSCMQ